MSSDRLEIAARRLEHLDRGSRDADCDVYEALGFDVVRLPRSPGGIAWRHKVDGRWIANRNLTTSLDDARALVRPGFTFAVGDCGENDGPWACVTCNETGRDFASKCAADVYLALCAAALRASAVTPPDITGVL